MKDNRRSFFKSLAMLGAAAAGCPGIFVPKFEPIRWKVAIPQQTLLVRSAPFNGRDFYGNWTFIIGDGEMAPYHKVVMPINEEIIEHVFHVRE